MIMRAAKLSPSASSQRGVAAIAVAVMFVTLFGFLAVVTDTGRLFLEKRSLQKNADLAALETALSFCRDQTMDEAERLAVATEVLSSDRNNFRGTASDITVELGRVNTITPADDPAYKQFDADDSGKAVRVALTRTVPASLFQQLLPSSSGDIVLGAEGISVACEPGAYLEIRSSVVNIDTAESDLLNPILGDLLGTTLALSAGQWDSLLDTNLNLLSYLDALAIDLGVTAGDYDTVLATDISVGQALDVAADVLTTAGEDPTAIAALQLLDTSITPASPPTIQLGELLSIQSDGPDEALDVGLQVLQLVQGTIQLANSKNALTADVPISVLGLADVLIRIKVIEPPQLSAIG
ncbi:MAG: pilus assembly protein TadG-related protein, partial [Spongiibacteraceae bacterium]